MIEFFISVIFILSAALLSEDKQSIPVIETVVDLNVSILPKTTIILLEQNQSKSAIDISTDTGIVTIDEPYSAIKLTEPNDVPSVFKVDKAFVEQKYKSTLTVLPTKPISILFYFKKASAEFSPESLEQIDRLIDIIKTREPCVVDIIAHTDTVGSSERNFALGLKRADIVKSFLQKKQVKMQQVTLQSYGETDLLIPTADNVAEPKNRRVEIVVR